MPCWSSVQQELAIDKSIRGKGEEKKMKQTQLGRVMAVICLLGLMTVAAQCSEDEELAGQLIANAVANTAIALEPTIFPVETEEATEEPKEVKVGFLDEIGDVFIPANGQLASNYWGGVDLTGVSFQVVDPSSGLVEFRASFDEVEDHAAELAANPYWGLIVAGDGDPEGTQPIAGLDLYGLGQWHVGCFFNGEGLDCELWIREDGQFTQEGDVFPAVYLDGDVVFTFPQGYPRPGDLLGVAVVDPYSADTLGLEDNICQLEVIELLTSY